MIGKNGHVLSALLVLATIGVRPTEALGQQAALPRRAREHALAWRANFEGIQLLTCEYRVWTATATSVDKALAFDFGPPCPDDGSCGYHHVSEQGVLYLRSPYLFEVVDSSDLGKTVYMREEWKIRLRAMEPNDNGCYARADMATASSPWWSPWQESENTPHRLMLMGDRLSTRVDCAILRDRVEPDGAADPGPIHVKENVSFYGHTCDEVTETVTARDGSVFHYRHYFDAQSPGVLWGKAVETPNSATLAVVREIRRLESGNWYPTRVVLMELDKGQRQLQQNGHVRALEVTRLVAEAPPLEELAICFTGDVWLTDLGKDGWVLTSQKTIRVDKLRETFEELNAEYEKVIQQQTGRVASRPTPASAASPEASGTAERQSRPWLFLAGGVVLAGIAVGVAVMWKRLRR